MQEAIRKYSEVFRKSISLLGEIQATKDEIKRKQIMDLWDEADK
jgi:hypothetical protein